MDLETFLAEWHNDRPTVLVHTSGSTGQPKPLWVEKRRMEASARITCRFLGLHEGDTALLCMPLDYIAGKMMVVRALTCGLRLLAVPLWEPPIGKVQYDFAAMVPLQVWNPLHDAAGRERLLKIRHLIIGGGAIDDALARALAAFPNNVWSTYGMTETLSHIALRRLNGPEASEWYTPFEGVCVSLKRGLSGHRCPCCSRRTTGDQRHSRTGASLSNRRGQEGAPPFPHSWPQRQCYLFRRCKDSD